MPAASWLTVAMVNPVNRTPDMEYSTSIIELSQFPSKNPDPPFPSGVSLLSARERSSESCKPQGPTSSTIHTSHRRPEGSNGLGLRAQQQIKCGDVRDHQHGHIDNRDSIRGAQPPCRLFLPNHKSFWVRRYVLCSVTERQPWLVAVFGTPSHGL